MAPGHVAQITALAAEGAYNDVVFHRVIDGFMAQTGDVQFGKVGQDMRMAGRGGSDKPDLPAEFSDRPFERGTVGMARSQSPDSANSQFFLMFDAAPHLNGEYTVVGQVTEGLDVLDCSLRAATQGRLPSPSWGGVGGRGARPAALYPGTIRARNQSTSASNPISPAATATTRSSIGSSSGISSRNPLRSSIISTSIHAVRLFASVKP